jgi:hypothetical protein
MGNAVLQINSGQVKNLSNCPSTSIIPQLSRSTLQSATAKTIPSAIVTSSSVNTNQHLRPPENVGAIVGAVIGGVITIFLFAGLAFFCVKRRAKRSKMVSHIGRHIAAPFVIEPRTRVNFPALPEGTVTSS